MKFNFINYGFFEDFISAYECGSYSEAADKLLSTPQSVGQNVRKLEKQLNDIKLFNTHAKGITPTSEGHNLYQLITRNFKEINNAADIIQDFNNQSYGQIRIGLCTYFNDFLLSKIFARFNKEYPNVSIITIEKYPDEAQDLLNKYNIDLILFVNDMIQETAEIETITLQKLETVFFMSKTFAKKNNLQNKITVEQLQELPIVGLPRLDSLGNPFGVRRDLEKFGISISPKIEVESRLVTNCVLQNMGIGYTTDKYFDDLNGSLIKLDLVDIELPKISFYCTYRKETKSKPVLAFINSLKKQFGIANI